MKQRKYDSGFQAMLKTFFSVTYIYTIILIRRSISPFNNCQNSCFRLDKMLSLPKCVIALSFWIDTMFNYFIDTLFNYFPSLMKLLHLQVHLYH